MKVSFMVVRAVLAVVLMVGFYLLALGIAFGLFWIVYAEVVYANRITPKLDLLCILGGLAILWSVLPRVDRFVAPGPRLTPEKHPKLFDQLQGVAKATQQEMPAEVYLVPDVNAWVMQRGGIMGFGSRRVMGLGLPLLNILTCSQFRAVLAHEFGHYHGGDTKIGPWIYKTRGAIMRTVSSLGRSLLQAPFRWYGKMFLRITHAISRRQEFVADELAARTIGAKALADGLCNVHKAAPAFAYYWQNECGPVLHAGFLPPVAEGFGRFVNAGSIAEKMNKHLEEQLASGKTDPYDTHPPLKDRIAAVANLPTGPALTEDPPAVSLLENVPALERELLVRAAGREESARLKDIVWADVGSQVYVPHWTKLAQLNAAKLHGIVPESLAKQAADIRNFGGTLVDFSGRSPFGESAENLAVAVVGATITLLLLQRGGKLDTAPGSDISVTLNGHRVLPFHLMPSLKSGAIKPEAWAQQCVELGINATDLASAVSGVGDKPTKDV
ncbi:MAG TPA: M48 family metallopeptidase [Verrucomicrobiae bacterium]